MSEATPKTLDEAIEQGAAAADADSRLAWRVEQDSPRISCAQGSDYCAKELIPAKGGVAVHQALHLGVEIGMADDHDTAMRHCQRHADESEQALVPVDEDGSKRRAKQSKLLKWRKVADVGSPTKWVSTKGTGYEIEEELDGALQCAKGDWRYRELLDGPKDTMTKQLKRAKATCDEHAQQQAGDSERSATDELIDLVAEAYPKPDNPGELGDYKLRLQLTDAEIAILKSRRSSLLGELLDIEEQIEDIKREKSTAIKGCQADAEEIKEHARDLGGQLRSGLGEEQTIRCYRRLEGADVVFTSLDGEELQRRPQKLEQQELPLPPADDLPDKLLLAKDGDGELIGAAVVAESTTEPRWVEDPSSPGWWTWLGTDYQVQPAPDGSERALAKYRDRVIPGDADTDTHAGAATAKAACEAHRAHRARGMLRWQELVEGESDSLITECGSYQVELVKGKWRAICGEPTGRGGEEIRLNDLDALIEWATPEEAQEVCQAHYLAEPAERQRYEPDPDVAKGPRRSSR